MEWLVVLAAAWIVVGAATAVILIRRGHDVATWAVTGLVFGLFAPLLGAIAVAGEAEDRPEVVADAPPGSGRVDVLAAVDGSVESLAALAAAVDLHRSELGRLTLATVVPFDSDLTADAEAVLRAAAATVDGPAPSTVVLRGEPVEALGRFAAEGGYRVLAVGVRGRGRSGSPLGSVATRLAATAPVAVLVGPSPSVAARTRRP